jgi:flagellar biosynthesis/type III secretory pathway chaperone
VKESLNKLIEALRHELEQYGEMLARLDHQQETVLRRDSTGVLDGAASSEQQAALIEVARSRRELARQEAAVAAGLLPDAPFGELLPRLPVDYRPLLRALVDENNELLERVRNRSRQNHLLLTRTVDLMQRLLGNLFSVKVTPTYSGDGALMAPAGAARSLYEAVG